VGGGPGVRCGEVLLTAPRSLVRPALLATLALLSRAPIVAAQHPADLVLLEDRTYHGGDFEPFRIFLARGLKYRVEFSEPNVVLQMRSYEGKSVPFARLIGDGPTASGETDYEIVANSDGVIEFRAVDGVPGTATRFRLWRVGPHREVAQDTTSSPVEFGVILRGGAHLPFLADSFTYAHAGSLAEGCIAVRGGGGILQRLGGCILGYAHMSGGLHYDLNFVFIEPRFRILGPPLRSGASLSAGGVLRINSFVGTSDSGGTSPPLGAVGRAAIGLYGAYDQRGKRRHGWQVEVDVLIENISADLDPSTAAITRRPGSSQAASVRVGGGWFF
jgi:hypothetical protein